MGYPDASGEASILKNRSGKNPLDDVQPCMNMEDIVRMQNETDTVFVHDEIYGYIVRLANATRTHELIKLGISPRGSLALTRMAKAHAYLYRRNYVMPDDVMAVFESTVAHRLIISPKAKVTSVTAEAIIAEILKNTEVPQISGRPDGK
jgi:MoxR-like ATPase